MYALLLFCFLRGELPTTTIWQAVTLVEGKAYLGLNRWRFSLLKLIKKKNPGLILKTFCEVQINLETFLFFCFQQINSVIWRSEKCARVAFFIFLRETTNRCVLLIQQAVPRVSPQDDVCKTFIYSYVDYILAISGNCQITWKIRHLVQLEASWNMTAFLFLNMCYYICLLGGSGETSLYYLPAIFHCTPH